MLALSKLDLEEVAGALADQTDYEHRWLIDPETGEILSWTRDGGVDGETPVDLDELVVVPIDPEPSHVWYQDMVDFVEGISDERAGRRLGRAIQGRGVGSSNWWAPPSSSELPRTRQSHDGSSPTPPNLETAVAGLAAADLAGANQPAYNALGKSAARTTHLRSRRFRFRVWAHGHSLG
jgi:hypothetical protein